MAAWEIDGTVYVSSKTMSDSAKPVSTSPVCSLKCSEDIRHLPGRDKIGLAVAAVVLVNRDRVG